MKSVFTEGYDGFVEKLTAARKAAGVTQADLAKRIGKPQSFVSKYERRERRLDVVEFLVICRAIGIDACNIIRVVESSLGSRPKGRQTR